MDCITPNKSNTFLLRCPSRSHFGIVFTRSQEFEEEVALVSRRTEELANDTANHQELDSMRSALARIGQDKLQLLFPGTSFTPAKASKARRKKEVKSLSPKREKELRDKGKERRMKQKAILNASVTQENPPVEPVASEVMPVENGSSNELFEEDGLDCITSESSDGSTTESDVNVDELPDENYADTDESESSSCSSENHSS
jgi:hypothetical protein